MWLPPTGCLLLFYSSIVAVSRVSYVGGERMRALEKARRRLQHEPLWVMLGRTTGRGKDDQTNRPNRSIKEVLGFPVPEDLMPRAASFMLRNV
jgi:hypothetical protein